jgi:hypothetical protein
MRKLVSAGITALALSGALLAGSSPATAAPPASAATSAVQQAVQAPRAVNEYYDWYWTRSNCNAAGSKMLVHGIIYGYACNLSIYGTWYLYVSY